MNILNKNHHKCVMTIYRKYINCQNLIIIYRVETFTIIIKKK